MFIPFIINFYGVELTYCPLDITTFSFESACIFIFGKDWTIRVDGVNCLIVLVAYSTFGVRTCLHYFDFIAVYNQALVLCSKNHTFHFSF